jgi:hypothetical protein
MTDGLIQFSPPVRFLKMTPPIGCLSEGDVASVNQSIDKLSILRKYSLKFVRTSMLEILIGWDFLIQTSQDLVGNGQMGHLLMRLSRTVLLFNKKDLKGKSNPDETET